MRDRIFLIIKFISRLCRSAMTDGIYQVNRRVALASSLVRNFRFRLENYIARSDKRVHPHTHRLKFKTKHQKMPLVFACNAYSN